MEFFQAIDALLDVLDATGTVVGLMALWYTWVVPPRIPPEPMALDLERFLQIAAVITPAQPPRAPLSPSGSPRSSCHPAA